MKKFLIKVNGNEYEVEVEEINQDGMGGQVIQETNTVNPAPVKAASVAANPASPASGNTQPNSNNNRNNNNNSNINNNTVPVDAQTIDAPMPGVIMDVKVNTGDVVKKGDVLLILEAMKMENEIVSPKDGKIASVNVSKGESVNAGDVLLSIG